MTEYNALKVPDLKAMLGQRKLPQTGNKQALIARLQEDDEKNASSPKADAKQDAKEDEISYSDDDAAAEKSAPAPAESKPEEPSKSEEEKPPAAGDNSAEAEAEAEGEKKAETATPAPSFAIGLASTAAEEEAKKRAERAKRFGIEEDDEEKRRAERAKRFGINQTELASGLDSALPERPLKRGRGRGADGDRAGKRQSLNRTGRHGRGPRQGGGKNNQEGNSVQLDAAERAKAEKRAARFATS